MGAIGRFFGALCFVGGRFGPMYAAGRLEAMNVGQYVDAAGHARAGGRAEMAAVLDEMVAEEARHEAWFGDQVRGHAAPAPGGGRGRPPPSTPDRDRFGAGSSGLTGRRRKWAAGTSCKRDHRWGSHQTGVTDTAPAPENAEKPGRERRERPAPAGPDALDGCGGPTARPRRRRGRARASRA